ncbi:MAG TPA: hypothetical protein VNA30_03690 [Mycobacteriales bacterium]|nr:hypothetical protein [Mycobacteriales bacterium]
MHGLTVQWSLSGTPTGTSAKLRDYVREESMANFTGMPGLHQKIWQLTEGGFFAGIYLWATAEARAEFLRDFRANPSAVSQLVGHEPDVIREWDVLAVAIGAEGAPA